MSKDSRRVLILGAGFAGLTAAVALGRRMRRHPRGAGQLEVVLVDRAPYQTLRPKLPEAVGGRIDCAVRLALAPLLEGLPVRFQQAEVAGIDTERQAVETDGGPIGYDRLVIALGSHAAAPPDFLGKGPPVLPVWSFDQACALRMTMEMLAQALAVPRAGETAPARTGHVLVIGGGFVGTELAAHLAERARVQERALRLPPGTLRITLVERRSFLVSPDLTGAVEASLGRRSVTVIAGDPVEGVEPLPNSSPAGTGPGHIRLASGRRLDADVIVWAGGALPSPLLAEAGLADPGRPAPVDLHLRSARRPEVFVVGDSGLPPGVDPGSPFAVSAQRAEAEGAAVARVLWAELTGRRAAPARSRELGLLLSFGHPEAAGRLGSLPVAGYPASWLKQAALAQYLYRLGGMRLVRSLWSPLFRDGFRPPREDPPRPHELLRRPPLTGRAAVGEGKPVI